MDDMNTRTRLLLFITAIAVIPWLIVGIQIANAATPVDYECNGANCAVFVDPPYCYAGSLYNLPYYNFTDRAEGETFNQYVDRKLIEIFNRPLNADESALCDVLRARNTPQWIVKQYQSLPDRPVKRIVNGTVDPNDTIGRITYGSPCGNEVPSGTSTMWREVTITYPDNQTITGAAVCEQSQ